MDKSTLNRLTDNAMFCAVMVLFVLFLIVLGLIMILGVGTDWFK